MTFEDCQAISCGSGQEGGGVADWSCGYDLIDTGHLLGLFVHRCRAVDSYQSGFHTDGSWEGHEQQTADLLFEDCESEGNGRRSGTSPTELYQNGFYLQDYVTLRRCTAKGNRKAGFEFKNEVPCSVVMEDCSDEGSAYSLVIEYGRAGSPGFSSPPVRPAGLCRPPRPARIWRLRSPASRDRESRCCSGSPSSLNL